MHPVIRAYGMGILAIVRRELPGPIRAVIGIGAIGFRVSRIYGTWKRLSGDPYAGIVDRR